MITQITTWGWIGIGVCLWVVISAVVVMLILMAKSRRDQEDNREV